MTDTAKVRLCPAQKAVLETLLPALSIGSVFRVWGGVGRGKTTILSLRAIEGVRENKQRYQEAEAAAALKPKMPLAGFTSYVMQSFAESGGGAD
jgi:predicted ATPase